MDPILHEWGSFLIRWTHVIAAIAWIGASFYFMHLDASIRPAGDIPKGKGGEAWEVHGGGFYQVRKWLVAPETLPAGAEERRVLAPLGGMSAKRAGPFGQCTSDVRGGIALTGDGAQRGWCAARGWAMGDGVCFVCGADGAGRAVGARRREVRAWGL